MSADSYWERARRGQLSRRSLLRTTALGGGAAFLAACGGSNNNTGSKAATTQAPSASAAASATAAATQAASGSPAAGGTPGAGGSPAAVRPGQNATGSAGVQNLLIPRTDTSAQAVPGGIYQSYTTADVTNLDPLSSQSFTANAAGAWMYPRLMSFKPGARVPADGQVEPHLAESVEQVDPTTITMKIRQNAVWDKRAPTNGRALDTDDIIFSWKKFVDKSVSRMDLANGVNPQAPIDSITAIDKNTIQIKAAYPYGPLLNLLAFGRYLQVMPRESDGGFDPRNDTRGAGAWMLTDYQRSVKFTYRKNPDWFLAGSSKLPYLDGYDIPIIAEYAAGLAQFRAKKIWSFALQQQDIIGTKKDLPELAMDKNAFGQDNWLIYFGMQPGSPFLDDRVRRAASMQIDRNTYIDTFFNTDTFKKAGYPVETAWNSHISAGYNGFWLDPQGKDLGAGAANFQLNQAEAKKLLQAAGVSTPIETDIAFISTGQYGTTFPNQCDAFKGMLEDSGLFKLRQVNPDYQTEYLPKYYYGKGDFKGIAVGASTTYPDVDGYMFAYYHTKGPRQKVAFQGQNGDAQSDSLIEAQRKELDHNKRVQIIGDWQKYMATKFLMIPYPGQSVTFSLFWPWISNFGVFRAYIAESGPQETITHYWFDKSKFTG